MSVHDARPSDIYVDATGKLWRCVMTCAEPTVTFEAVEGYIPSANPNVAFGAVQVVPYHSPTPQLVRDRKSGGVNGLMWEGWKRIYRAESADKPSHASTDDTYR